MYLCMQQSIGFKTLVQYWFHIRFGPAKDLYQHFGIQSSDICLLCKVTKGENIIKMEARVSTTSKNWINVKLSMLNRCHLFDRDLPFTIDVKLMVNPWRCVHRETAPHSFIFNNLQKLNSDKQIVPRVTFKSNDLEILDFMEIPNTLKNWKKKFFFHVTPQPFSNYHN